MPMPFSPTLPSDSGGLTIHGQPSVLQPSLIQAYQDACYEVVLPAPEPLCVLRVGQPHPQLLRTMQQHGVQQACVLTACNPQGALLPDAQNLPRMHALRETLRQSGWSWAPAMGRDPCHQWPGEDSLCIWHMGLGQATEWGARWEQNAVLAIGPDACPRLVLLR